MLHAVASAQGVVWNCLYRDLYMKGDCLAALVAIEACIFFSMQGVWGRWFGDGGVGWVKARGSYMLQLRWGYGGISPRKLPARASNICWLAA